MPEKQTYTISGDKVVAKVKEIIKEGNARKIIIKNEKKETVAEFPITVGVIGAVIAPVLAAIGALVALMSECTIEVEK